MSYEKAIMNRSYFTKWLERTEADILKDSVIFTKNKCSTRGSIEYGIHYGLDTKAVNIKF